MGNLQFLARAPRVCGISLCMDDKPMHAWHVDPALAPAIEEVLPDLSQEILDAIAREVPEYARPLRGPSVAVSGSASTRR